MFLTTPEQAQKAFQKALYTQTRAAADFNKRVFDWQLGQLALVEKQLSASVNMSAKAVGATVDAATAMQAQVVEAFAPAADE